MHLLYIVAASIGLVFLIILSCVIALLYNETQPIKEDSLARVESSLEIMMLFYRIFVVFFLQMCDSQFCSWVLIITYNISSIVLTY